MSNMNSHKANKHIKKDQSRLGFKLDAQKSRVVTQNIIERKLLVINFAFFWTGALLPHGMQPECSIS